MSNQIHSALGSATADERGYTVMEVVTVCAIMGLIAALGYPSMNRFAEKQQAKSSATQMAGILSEARSRAVAEGTPHLVYINPKTVDAAGNCGPAAEIVRDTDRSYSITAGDQVRQISLEPGACTKVEPFGTPGGSTEVADIPMPPEDEAVRALGLGEVVEGVVGGVAGGVGGLVGGLLGGEPNEPNAAVAPEEPRTERVADAVVNGATFPLDADSGRPVIAFSERGIPVDPQTPTSWGSGAGAVYVTDRHSMVYAAVVRPMGGVKLRVFDNAKGDWR
jgi:type II secretory pathway pseudopilin PulG